MGTGGRIIHIGSTNAERMPFAGGAIRNEQVGTGPEAANITGASLMIDGGFAA